ncbi:hypothetical protein [Coleofasciculus sp. FACHB-129]|uniref:hypothetical protein n=1 Tax=Cyanophyceae TaxID=3028117 RepID=UPI001687BEE2|nr:hypothetical protein [Coleofasciculus sp. FACHB-129]MBD1895762.1 hypothetical protein [Coleofasciculus sp. FACHB-129]
MARYKNRQKSADGKAKQPPMTTWGNPRSQLTLDAELSPLLVNVLEDALTQKQLGDRLVALK